MREIKFRGKDIASNKWAYGYLYRLKGVYTICENIRYDEQTPIFIDTLGQYIGLKDKNSVEIYEGDIVKDAWGINMLVKYINTGFYLCRKNTNGEYSKISNWRNLQTKEVIGNIYNNPELLKGE